MIRHTLKTLWAAIRYFFLGLATALLTAPQTGADSRRLLRERIMAIFDSAVPTTATHEQNGGGALDKEDYWENAVTPENHPTL